MNDNINYNESNKNKKIFIIIGLIVIICVCIFIYFKFVKINKDKTETVNSNTQNIIDDKRNSNVNNTNNEIINSNTDLGDDENGAFLMAIKEIFEIYGQGTIITGKIERGTIQINDEVQIVGINSKIESAKVAEIDMFKKERKTATVGEEVNLVLEGIEVDKLQGGQVIAKPNSIDSASKFEAKVYLLSKDEGGRKTPLTNGYRPQFYFRTIDITGMINLPNNIEKVNPGENVNMTVELLCPVAMEIGTEFDIREGGRTIGKGTITKVYQ